MFDLSSERLLRTEERQMSFEFQHHVLTRLHASILMYCALSHLV